MSIKKIKTAVKKQVAKTKTAIVKNEMKKEIAKMSNPNDTGFSITQGLDIGAMLTPELISKFITPELLAKMSGEYLPKLAQYLKENMLALSEGQTLNENEFLCAIVVPTGNNISMSIIVMNASGEIVSWVKTIDAATLINSNVETYLANGSKEIQ